MNPNVYILISVLLAVIAQLSFKKGVQHPEITGKEKHLWSMMRLVFGRYVFFGFLMYGISTIFWLIALSKLELSYAFPFISLALVLTSLFGALIFKEKLSFHRKLGIGIICVGILLIAQS